MTVCDINTCKKPLPKAFERHSGVILGKSFIFCKQCYECLVEFVKRRLSSDEDFVLPYTVTHENAPYIFPGLSVPIPISPYISSTDGAPVTLEWGSTEPHSSFTLPFGPINNGSIKVK